ncbi:MAG: Rrf2 family transcriptional regulator [bacterium]
MQFTKAEEYGLLGVLHLAAKDRTSVTPLSEVSEAKDIPEKFLAKIFQSLSRSGIVRSHRGVRGGFTLTRDPEQVTIREVLESIQGPYHLLKCVQDSHLCDKSDGCSVRNLLILAEAQLWQVFDTHTLADLIGWEAGQLSPAQQLRSL